MCRARLCRQLPVVVSRLKHYQFQQKGNSRRHSVTCYTLQATQAEKERRSSLGHLRQANRIQVFLQILSTADWGPKGDIHRTHPVPHLSELWAGWLLLWGLGVESCREPGSWWGETWEWTCRSFCYSKHIWKTLLFSEMWNAIFVLWCNLPYKISKNYIYSLSEFKTFSFNSTDTLCSYTGGQ